MRFASGEKAERALYSYHRREDRKLEILSTALVKGKGYLCHYKLDKEENIAFVGFVGKGECAVFFSTERLGF